MDASRRIFLAAVSAWWPVRRVPANHHVIFLPGKSCRVPTLAEWRGAGALMPRNRPASWMNLVARQRFALKCPLTICALAVGKARAAPRLPILKYPYGLAGCGTMLVIALSALGFPATKIRERLGNRYSIHQVRRQVREIRSPPWPQFEKARKQGWRYVIPEGPPELWTRLGAETKRYERAKSVDLVLLCYK